jgi:hypothetical protein
VLFLLLYVLIVACCLCKSGWCEKLAAGWCEKLAKVLQPAPHGFFAASLEM